MQITCIFQQYRNILAEGPLWHPQEQALYWVDIPQYQLHRFELLSGAHRFWQFQTEIGCIGLHTNNGLIAAMRSGFAHITLPSGKLTMLNEPIKNRNDVIFNDGKCDRQGCFWAGTKDVKEERPVGSIYRLDNNNNCAEMDTGFTVSNGLAWSPDNKIIYICDSPARHIYQYDFDSETGGISNKRIFAIVAEDAGFPDGLTVDSKGYIWSAHWNGWRITRYKPTGEIAQVIPMPVPHVTSCSFGGSDLKTLFITTASRGLSAAELTKAPQAGYIFAITTQVHGLAEPIYTPRLP
jgi:sugar lactone lactonase YvrE